MGFLFCFLYLLATGLLFYFLGRIVPKRWFRGDRFPFRVQPWEQKLYQKLRVKQWQNLLPDMSRIFPALMPAKKMTQQTLQDLPRMIEETCVAEAVHTLLSLTGLACLWLWPGGWGIALTVLYILLGNVSFIIIQRYNRPRLEKLLAAQEKQRARRQGRDPECER